MSARARRIVVLLRLGDPEGWTAFRLAIVALGAFALAWAPSLAVPVIGLRWAALVGLVGGLGAGILVTAPALVPIALALLPASFVVSSELLPYEARYLPIAFLAVALSVGVVRGLRSGAVRPRVPPLWVTVALGAYAAWAAVSTVTSIDRSTSVVYLVGIGGSFALAFVLVPTALADRSARLVAAGFAALAAATVLGSAVLALTGPFTLFGRYPGLFEIEELTILGHPLGVVLPRATSVFSTPGYPGLALAVGLCALLPFRSGERRAVRWLVDLALVGVLVALFVMFGRSGWLAAAVGAGAYAVVELSFGRVDRIALALSAVLFLALALLTLDILGANLRYDVAVERYGPTLAATLPGGSAYVASPEGDGGSAPPSSGDSGSDGVQFRGGTDLSGRLLLWKASLSAIEARPLTGSGPGTNPDALLPYLTGQGARHQGQTSHNTWLRTAVELGIPGLLAFVAFGLAAAWAALSRFRRGPRGSDDRFAAALVAAWLAILVAQGFDAFFLGGLSYPGFAWTLAIGVVIAVPLADRLIGARAHVDSPPPGATRTGGEGHLP